MRCLKPKKNKGDKGRTRQGTERKDSTQKWLRKAHGDKITYITDPFLNNTGVRGMGLPVKNLHITFDSLKNELIVYCDWKPSDNINS